MFGVATSPPRPRSQFQIFDRDVVLVLAESRQEFLVEYGFFEAIDEARIYVIMERKFNLKYSIKGVSVPSLKLVGMAVLMVRTSPLTETLSTIIPLSQSVAGCDATEDVKIVNVMQQIVVTVIGAPEVRWGTQGGVKTGLITEYHYLHCNHYLPQQ